MKEWINLWVRKWRNRRALKKIGSIMLYICYEANIQDVDLEQMHTSAYDALDILCDCFVLLQDEYNDLCLEAENRYLGV